MEEEVVLDDRNVPEVYLDDGIIPKLWGYEKILVNKKQYCGKILVVHPNGKASSIHYHRSKTETFHVLDGFLELELWMYGKVEDGRPGSLLLDDYDLVARMTMVAGMTLTLKPGLAHRFWTKRESARFIEFSSFDDPADTFRLMESGDAPVERD